MEWRDDHNNLPSSSYQSSVEKLLSSLLVPRNGQLIPASSALSQDAEKDALSTCINSEGEASSEQSQHAGRPHVSIQAEAPRVKDTKTSERFAAGEYQKRLPSALYRRGGADFGKVPSSSPPCSAEAAPPSKLSSSQHRRALGSFKATPIRKTRARIEAYGGVENLPPPSGQMADPSNNVVPVLQDIDMENSGFAFTSNSNNLNLMSIEAWEKENPYSPPATKPMSPPASDITPARLERNKGKDTQTFNTECQRRGLTHEFRFDEVAKGCFDVTLFVEGQKFDRAGPYASHRDAKEAMCRLALGKLSELEFKNAAESGSGKKRKSSELSGANSSIPDGIEDENWLGIINSKSISHTPRRGATLTQRLAYAQQQKLEYPDYEFEEEPQSYKCTMSFAGTPLQAFGLSYGPFPSKNTAKKAAAMEAVKWLRAEGKLSSTPLTTTKRRKSSLPQQPDPNAMTDSPSTPSPSATSSESAAQQVFDLARRLGFSQPKFNTFRREGNFVDESATFMEKDVRYEPRLEGTHGQVRRVFGKKAAHEECCRLVVRFLKRIQRERTMA